MGQYRLNSIAQLARQMRFAPIPKRLEQLNAAEDLLLKLNPDQTYTINDVTCAVTGYEPKDASAEMLTGIALQHDLGLLLEDVSDSLQLHVNASPEPVLMIEQVAQRLSVTTKTVQRWRRRGLPARRYTFGDNKRRIGFRFSSVQRFVSSASGAPEGAAQPTSSRDLRWLRERATKLAREGYWRLLAGQRLARAAGISPLAIAQILREHAPEIVLIEEPLPAVRARVVEQAGRGAPLRAIAAELKLPLYGVYRIIVEDRLTRAMRKRIRFHDDVLYHGEDALSQIEAIIAQDAAVASDAETLRLPRDVPGCLRELCRVAPLTPNRERGLFLKYHYLRHLAHEQQKTLDTQISRYRELRKLETLRREARLVRARIVEANLRLVVSVARKHLRPGVSMLELVSEGNLTLMRAVDGFDIHRGNRFSTYAVYALMRGFARYIPATIGDRRHLADPERLSELRDPTSSRPAELALARDEVVRLLDRLERREREVLAARYGLDDRRAPLSSRELGEMMHLSSQRITQIERNAMTKLRSFAAVGEVTSERL